MDTTVSKCKIAIVSHALAASDNQSRWRRLSEDKRYEIHLLVPKYWESHWFDKKDKIIFKPEEVHDDNFHVHPLATTDKRNHRRYLFTSFDARFRLIKPDLIYIVHEEGILIHQQIYLYKKLFADNAKVIFFSMNASGVPTKRFYHRWMWRNIKNSTDAAFVHYPGCLESLRNAGYTKPIYLQTQIGVNEALFRPNSASREQYRDKLGFKTKFVIGYAGRLTREKGIDDLLAVMPLEGIDWALLFIGIGNMQSIIEARIKQEGWEDRVHITGFIDLNEVPGYMNAMDCFVLGSKTTNNWIDTFPLVTVQAQASGVPVIASDSASLPWQLADTALFFHEGDKKILKEKLLTYAQNPATKEEYAKRGRERCLGYFSHESLSNNFKKIAAQVLEGKTEYHRRDEDFKPWKAY